MLYPSRKLGCGNYVFLFVCLNYIELLNCNQFWRNNCWLTRLKWTSQPVDVSLLCCYEESKICSILKSHLTPNFKILLDYSSRKQILFLTKLHFTLLYINLFIIWQVALSTLHKQFPFIMNFSQIKQVWT